MGSWSIMLLSNANQLEASPKVGEKLFSMFSQKPFIAGLATISAGLIYAGYKAYYRQSQNKCTPYPIKDITTLKFQLDDCRVKLQNYEGNSIMVDTLGSYTTLVEGNTLWITNYNKPMPYTIRVPTQSYLNIRGRVGNLEAHGVQCGSIDLDNIRGEYQITRTISGEGCRSNE